MLKSIKTLTTLGSALLISFLYSSTVLASGDAVSDILNDARYKGAIESIDGATNLIDHYMTMVITTVAFMIISFAIFKNVCAGLYLAFPKFWNKVSEAHKEHGLFSDGAGKRFGFNGAQFINQSPKMMILALVPDVKAITDFEGEEMSPKEYWVKAIPKMLACIIIGIFIYNGFYRDTASVVGSFGSEVIKRALASTDPVSAVDSLLLTTGTPDNIYENDSTPNGKIAYEISYNLYKAYRAEYKIKDTPSKTALMRNCEQIAYDFVSSGITNWDGVQYYGAISGIKIAKVSSLPGAAGTALVLSTGANTMTMNGFYGPTGINYLYQFWGGSATDGSHPSNTNSYGITLYHVAPDVNGLAGSTEFQNAAYFAISATITRTPRDGQNIDTAIQGQGVSVGYIQSLGRLKTGDSNTSGEGLTVEGASTSPTVKVTAEPTGLKNSAIATITNELQRRYGEEYAVDNVVVTLSGDGSTTNVYAMTYSASQNSDGSYTVYNVGYKVMYTVTLKQKDGQADITSQNYTTNAYITFNHVTITN